jgi:hypothetical protein
MSAKSAVLSAGHAFSSVDLAEVSALMTVSPTPLHQHCNWMCPSTYLPSLMLDPGSGKQEYDNFWVLFF